MTKDTITAGSDEDDKDQMRRQKEGGRIINVGSIGGIVGYPFSAAYCSAKFALEGLSESMSYEVESFNIKVILIEPALVISDFHNNAKIVIKSDKAANSSSYTQTMNIDIYLTPHAFWNVNVSQTLSYPYSSVSNCSVPLAVTSSRFISINSGLEAGEL
jgi:short-subunit dehydrogenase